jgi:hypothetical protein
LRIFLRFEAWLNSLASKYIGFETGYSIEKEDAVQVIQFVLKAYGFKSFAFHVEWMTQGIDGVDQDFGVSPHTGCEVRDRQAAFASGRRSFAGHQIGVEHDEQAVSGMLRGYVNDK